MAGNATSLPPVEERIVEAVGAWFLDIAFNPAAVITLGLSGIVAGQLLKFSALFNTEGWERELGIAAVALACVAYALGGALFSALGALVLLALLVLYLASGVDDGPSPSVRELAALSIAGAALSVAAVPFAPLDLPKSFGVQAGVLAASFGAWAGSAAAPAVHQQVRRFGLRYPGASKNAYLARISGYDRAGRRKDRAAPAYGHRLAGYAGRGGAGGVAAAGAEGSPQARPREGGGYVSRLGGYLGRVGAGGAAEPAPRARPREGGGYVSRLGGYLGRGGSGVAGAVAEGAAPPGAAEPSPQARPREGGGYVSRLGGYLGRGGPGPEGAGASRGGPAAAGGAGRAAYGAALSAYGSDGAGDVVTPFLARARKVLSPDAARPLADGLRALPPARARSVVAALVGLSAAVRRHNAAQPASPVRLGELMERHLVPAMAADGTGWADLIWMATVASGLLQAGVDPRPTLDVLAGFAAQERSGAFSVGLAKKREIGKLAVELARSGADPAQPLREGLERLGFL